MYIFMYETTNTINNKKYIGIHKTTDLEDGYIGSGYVLRSAIKKYGRKFFNRKILEFFTNETDAYAREKEIVNEEFIKRKDTYNIALGGRWNGGWKVDSDGKFINVSWNRVTVKDRDGNTMSVSVDDPRYRSGELVALSKNRIVVKDDKEAIFCVSKSEFLNNDKLKSINADKITVKDKDGNIYQVAKDDPRYLSGELVGVTKGLAMYKDKDGNTYQTSKADPRVISGELVGIMKGHKHTQEFIQNMSKQRKNLVPVRDKTGTKFLVSTDDPRYISGELVYHSSGQKRNLKLFKCPHCDKEGKGGGFTSNHFDNCKFKTTP